MRRQDRIIRDRLNRARKTVATLEAVPAKQRTRIDRDNLRWWRDRIVWLTLERDYSELETKTL